MKSEGDWDPGSVRMAPGELEPDTEDYGADEDREHRKHRRQVQWGRAEVIIQGDINPRRLVSLETEDPNAPLQGFIVSCSRNILNPLGVNQPAYHIQAGVGGLIWDWRNLAPGTYILYAQSIKVYVVGNLLAQMSTQAWAGRTEAAPTLVLP